MNQTDNLEVGEALNVIDGMVPPERGTVEVPVIESSGGVLQEDLAALFDSPRRDNSAMDGYVFRRKDLDRGQRRFPVRRDVRPEDGDQSPLEKETCARIVTGAGIPAGADFVVPVEMVKESEPDIAGPESVEVTQWIEVRELPGKNPVRKRGEGFRTGEVLLKKGTIIRPYELGLMIESGHTGCRVQSPVRISIQVTGSEVTSQNDSNGPVLCALMHSWPSVTVTGHPVVADDSAALHRRLTELKVKSDVIVTTGGISAGAYDYLFDILGELGAECLIRKINQKPGKPFTLFRWDDVVVCCLPGNPVSSIFTTELYVSAVVRKLQGLPPVTTAEARLDGRIGNPGSRTLFLPVRLWHRDAVLIADPGSDTRMRSHLLQLFRDCNGFLRIPPATELKSGSPVMCYPFSSTISVL